VPESGDRGGASRVVAESSEPPTGADRSEELEHQVRERLRACPATRALADGTLTRLQGGFSNHAWRVEGPGGPWFARLGAVEAPALGVDRASECALLAAVGTAGLAPAVLACEPAAGLLVTRYIEAPPWRADEVAHDRNLGRMAAVLRRLHELPVPDAVASMNWSAQARRLGAGLTEAPDDAEIHGRAADVLACLEARAFTPTLCHHDLHHLNVLDDGERLWLVDWEYGGRGDPLLDIAGLVSMNGLGPSATGTFIEAYGRLAPADRDSLDAARWAFDYVQWLWYRLRSGPGEGEAGERARRLARRLLHCDNPAHQQVHG